MALASQVLVRTKCDRVENFKYVMFKMNGPDLELGTTVVYIDGGYGFELDFELGTIVGEYMSKSGRHIGYVVRTKEKRDNIVFSQLIATNVTEREFREAKKESMLFDGLDVSSQQQKIIAFLSVLQGRFYNIDGQLGYSSGMPRTRSRSPRRKKEDSIMYQRRKKSTRKRRKNMTKKNTKKKK